MLWSSKRRKDAGSLFAPWVPDGTTKDALPSDTNVSVVILAGTPSAEGPRTTAKDQSFTFKTYGALHVIDKQCGYQSDAPV